MKRVISFIIFIYMMFTMTGVASATLVTVTYTTTVTISHAPVPYVVTTVVDQVTVTETMTVTDTVTETTSVTDEDVYKQLYSALLRISYLEQVSSMQSRSIASLLAENSSLKSQNSVYMSSLSTALDQVNSMSSVVSSLSYENAMLSAQLEYYKSNYEALYTAVAINFNELNSATSFYSSVEEKQEAANRTFYATAIAVLLAVVGVAVLYRKYISYRTMRRHKKRLI